jgi:hypothetical protein
VDFSFVPFFFIYFPSVGFSLRGFVAKLQLLLTARPIYMRKVKSVQCSIVLKRNMVLIKLRKHVHRWPC